MAHKQYNRKTYNPTATIEIIAWTEDTSYGFRHLVQLSRKNEYGWRIVGQAKACYYNRTWERYDYESVIHDLINKSEIRNKKSTIKKVDDMALGRVHDDFGAIGAVMALGDIFSSTPADANAWKLRMLQAGVPDGAIIMPDDWDALPEPVKEMRLNAIIKEFKK